MFLQPSRLPARVLAFACLASFAALGAALVAQHQFGVRPCPWCVMQRGIFLLIGVVAGLGWLLKAARPLRALALSLVVLLALAGLAAAYYQWDVASKLASCDMTFADRVLSALDLETRWPDVFMVTASCSEAAAYRLLGLPYEIWSGLLYLVSAVAALSALGKR